MHFDRTRSRIIDSSPLKQFTEVALLRDSHENSNLEW